MAETIHGGGEPSILVRLLSAAPFSCLAAAALFLFPTLQAMMVNIADIESPLNVLWDSRMPQMTVLTAVVLLAPAAVLKGKAYARYLGLLVALSAILYIQANVFVWRYGVVDGSTFDFSGKTLIAVTELIVWFAVIAAGVILSAKIVSRRRAIAVILLALFAINLFGTPGALRLAQQVFAPKPDSPDEIQMAENTKRVAAFSKKRNVVLWISDGLQSNIAEDLLKTTPKLASQFSGFTFFSDAMGQYRQTRIAIPAMLSGKVYDGSVEFKEFMDRQIKPNNISHILTRNNIVTEMVANRFYCGGFDPCTNRWHLTPLPNQFESEELRANIVNISLFRVAPHAVKPFIFDGLDGVGKHFVRWRNESAKKWTTHTADTYFYNWFAKQIYATDMPPTFKVFYSTSSHHPYIVGSDCNPEESASRMEAIKKQYHCNMTVFANFVQHLKAIGEFEDTLLIWVADHGSRQNFAKIRNGPFSTEMSEASVTFMVKPFGNAKDPVHFSNAPVQLSDVAPTVLDAFGLPYDGMNGEPVFEVNDPNRVRRYFSFSKEWRTQPVEMFPFDVKGPRLDPDNWTPIEKTFMIQYRD